MSYPLIKDGAVVIRDGVVVMVPNVSGNSSCECCGGDPCDSDCATTSQGAVTAVRVGGGACGPGVTECNYANATIPFSAFNSNSAFCYWDFYLDTSWPTLKTLTVVYNHTASPQVWTIGCTATVQPGEWYIIMRVYQPSYSVFINWSKNNASVSCSGGQLSFAESLTQCYNNWAGCGDCGTVTVSK
jgi:hypothetical protein